MKLPLYTIQGEKKGTVEVPDGVFGVKASPELIHQVVVSAQSNLRKPYAHTKDRSEVRGGGRKPWKQKGTGRARHGSNRSPIWVGGGVTFGPTNERNFHKKINKKMNRKALFAELSEKAASNALCVAETLQFEEAKTKNGAMFLHQVISSLSPKIQDEKKKKTLGSVIVWGTVQDANFSRVLSNIPRVDVRRVENMNLLDVMSHTYAIFSQSALDNFVQVGVRVRPTAAETIKENTADAEQKPKAAATGEKRASRNAVKKAK